MDGKRKLRGWRLGVAIGGLMLVAILALMAIGLAVGSRKKDARPGGNGEALEQKAGGYGVPSKQKDVKEPAVATAGQAAGVRTQVQQVPETDSKTIKTGALSLEIKSGSFNESYTGVQQIAEGVGGLISDSRSNTTDGRITGGTITLRVPNDSFGKVMDQLRELGKVVAVSEQAQDVTEEYVDLESRIRNLRSQESVYLGLMARTATIDEAIAVQRELSIIQGQIEELTGRANYLDNHVSFSIIKVSLAEPGAAAVREGEGWGFVGALKDAAHGVVEGLNAVVRFGGRAIVYVVIVAAVALLAYYLVKKRTRVKHEVVVHGTD